MIKAQGPREPIAKIDDQTMIALRAIIEHCRQSRKPLRIMARKMGALVQEKFPAWRVQVKLADELARAIYGELTFAVMLNGHFDSLLLLMSKPTPANDM